MKTVKILVPFRYEVGGKAVEFVPGTAEMPDEAVDAFVRSGYAALIEAEPAVKIVEKPKAQIKAVK